MANIDFELGVYYSLKKVFPHSDLVGCDVHWKRNLRDNMREVGLVKYLNTELAVQKFLTLDGVLCNNFHYLP